jgi:multidrug efflux pump subunit AcrB
MSLAAVAIEKRAVTYFSVVLLALGGIASFFQLGWLEDPEYTVKTAAITVPYPGAAAASVELEVTDLIETKLQEMVELKEVYSYSRPGLAIIKAEILPAYWADELPQVWDVLRKKVRDVEGQLPPGAGPVDVADDFGFVLGFLLAPSSRTTRRSCARSSAWCRAWRASTCGEHGTSGSTWTSPRRSSRSWASPGSRSRRPWPSRTRW